METAPLTLAYMHARNAAQETKRSNPVAASEEHDLAAAEFAAAAATTTDREALRVLYLLEQHHRQLGQILKDLHSKPAGHDKSKDSQHGITADEFSLSTTLQPPRLARTGRTTARDLSSSIASNLASARGIPHIRQKRTAPVSPLLSNEHADGTFSQDSTEQRKPPQPSDTMLTSFRPSWAPPDPVAPVTAPDTPISDSPFAHFYNKFEGAIATLTAPLAFASLPLMQQTAPMPKPDQEPKQSLKPKPPPASPSPAKTHPTKADSSAAFLDYSHLISSAALRAVRDNNGSGAPHESFYVVQTSGGTMSYADITAANYVDRQLSRGHHREFSNTSNDDFVDASSQILSPPPIPSILSSQHVQSNSKDPRAGNAQQKYQGKTMEELHLENQVLRRTINDFARRLHGFELAAQTSSAALAQSIRSLHLSPVTTPENSRGKTIPVSGGLGSDLSMRMAQKRIDELEDALKKHDRRLSRRDEENAKLKDTLGKYREKWEGLKAGAKARREQAGGGDKLRRASSNATTATVASRSPAQDVGQDAKRGDET